MKIAVAGKGGAGKTTFTATAARLIARREGVVVAIDGDTNPNLHAALVGSGADPSTVGFLPTSLVARRFGGPSLVMAIDDVLDQYSVDTKDGVRLLRMGAPDHPDEGCLCSAHATVSGLLADLEERSDIVTFLDLEASPEHLSRGTARHADVLVLIAEPYFRSLEAARLQATLAAETSIGRVVVVANKCRDATDGEAVAEFCLRHDMALVATIPWSDDVLDADAAGVPLLDHSPDCDVVSAIETAIEQLVASLSRRQKVDD